MGKVFLEHINGKQLYNCANCNTNLTNMRELLSTRFIGHTGPAILFNRVVNLKFSEPKNREMLTGQHAVREVECKNCKAKLGWVYECAKEQIQRRKVSSEYIFFVD
uniref:Protein yippee-like n=1 Tax=Anopheles christyi TaxID=43041 RepID=A0A182KCT2_9DIPT